MKFPYRLLVLPALLAAVAFPLRAADASAPVTVPVESPVEKTTGRLQAGEVAPEFSVVDVKGATVKLSDFKGKVVIVDVSATWCGPCQAAMPNNDRVYRKYAEQGVVLLGITADDTKAAYDGWMARNASKYAFPMMFDPLGRDGWKDSVFNTQYHITGFPTMFVVGRDGKISEILSGGGPGEDYRLEYALARTGIKVDLASLPPEPKKAGPQAIPMMTKTAAMPASTAMIGMGAPAPAGGGFTPEKFGSIARGAVVPDFTVTGKDGQPVKLSNFRGKTLLLQFCTGNGPQPWFAAAAAAYQDQSLQALAVFSATDKADFDKWVAANPNPGFAVAWDPAGKAWAENTTNTIFGVGMYPATAVLNADGALWSGTIGMGDKVSAMVYSMLARNGIKLTKEHMDALVAAGGAMRAGGSAAGAAPAAPKAPFAEKYGKLKAGDLLPDFTVITADGKEAKFSDYAKGKTVVLDFWATWCGPCQQAMPHYEEMHRKYAPKGVVFLGICCFDTRPNYDKWVATNKDKYTFTTVFDPVGKPASGDKEAMKKTIMMQLSGGALTPLPTTLVINTEGKLVGNYVGYGAGTHAGLANLLMLAGVSVNEEDKPKEFFPAGSTVRAMPAATIKAAPGSDQPAPARPATLAAGAVAPDFTMKDLAGKDVKLSDFKGKVVILDFWATWCGPCIASFPHTAKIATQYKDQDVVVLASCTSDTRAAFEKWMPVNQPKYADILFAADPNERGSATFDKRASSALYGVVGIPTQFVIGRDGKIVATIVGNGGEGDARTEGALALAGVKVDEALATKGKAALVAAAEEDKQSAIQAAETAKNPPPPFFEGMGKLVNGQPLPLADFTAQGPDGQPVKFSDLAKGKTVVLNVWNALNASDFVAFQETWARHYAGQNVQFVALISYCSREDYDKFLADQAGKFSFPVIFDPVGKFAAPAKTPAEMTVEEKKEFTARQREHFGKVIAMQLTGGMMLPIPNNLVLDAQGNLLGGYVGAGEKSAPALGNLLHRAGVKLAPEDLPKKIYTREETKPKAPPAAVAMLKVGAPAPDFPATDAAGQAVKVSDYRGKVVILDFWATWCGPCIASMPHTNEVAAHYKDQGVVVLASCTSDTRAKFDAWVKANQAKYPDMLFSHDPLEKSDDRASRKLYGVGGIPQQFIIGRDGKIAALCTGYLKGEVLLEAALAQAGVKVAPEILAKAKLDQANRDALK
ncbi:MAG: redoxin domain-containing protein [Lacunisphaera sp.]|nr:redoxin domain-containing protein [Lacunisphaera sp.]